MQGARRGGLGGVDILDEEFAEADLRIPVEGLRRQVRAQRNEHEEGKEAKPPEPPAGRAMTFCLRLVRAVHGCGRRGAGGTPV